MGGRPSRHGRLLSNAVVTDLPHEKGTNPMLRRTACCLSACRYAVVYRLLHGVLVIVVSRSHANVFANLNLVAAISRLLVAELKSVEITSERLLKKYAQVGDSRVDSSRVTALQLCVCVSVCLQHVG